MFIRKFLIGSFSFILILVVFSCEQEEILPSTQQNSDQAKSLPLSYLHSHTFSLTEIETLLDNENTHHFRFTINRVGMTGIDVDCIAISEELEELGSAAGILGEINLDMTALQTMPSISNEKITAAGEVLARHILQPQTAWSYITTWNDAISSGNSVDAYFQVEDETVEVALIEKEMLQNIVDGNNTTGLSLFWGVNDENNITTVFMGYDANDNAIIESTLSSGFIIDVVKLGPPFKLDYLVQ